MADGIRALVVRSKLRLTPAPGAAVPEERLRVAVWAQAEPHVL